MPEIEELFVTIKIETSQVCECKSECDGAYLISIDE